MFIEIIARTLKNILRESLRDDTTSTSLSSTSSNSSNLHQSSEFNNKEKIVNFLNLICSNSESSQDFWNNLVPGNVFIRFGEVIILKNICE